MYSGAIVKQGIPSEHVWSSTQKIERSRHLRQNVRQSEARCFGCYISLTITSDRWASLLQLRCFTLMTKSSILLATFRTKTKAQLYSLHVNSAVKLGSNGGTKLKEIQHLWLGTKVWVHFFANWLKNEQLHSRGTATFFLQKTPGNVEFVKCFLQITLKTIWQYENDLCSKSETLWLWKVKNRLWNCFRFIISLRLWFPIWNSSTISYVWSVIIAAMPPQKFQYKQTWNRLIVYILYLMRKAGLIHFQTLFKTISMCMIFREKW